jgi:hypothetical protein
LAEICQSRTADKGRIFKGFSVAQIKKCSPGAYAQEIAGPKDIQRIFTNFYGAALMRFYPGNAHV